MTSKLPKKSNPSALSTNSDVASFLAEARDLGKETSGKGGLIFALDATMSRQQTWDQAQHLQSQMFQAVEESGGLNVQLVYFRGFGECRASRWVSETDSLRSLMLGLVCQGGQTQIGKVFSHIAKESAKRNPVEPTRKRVDAAVFVGDAMEEDVDALCQKAGEIGILGVPCFFFQDGRDPVAEAAFREFARLTKGAYARFDARAAPRLAELLKSVARFASGGHGALRASGSREDKLLLEQLK